MCAQSDLMVEIKQCDAFSGEYDPSAKRILDNGDLVLSAYL
jgi:hypothetical protein